jgi:tetratricopeptide (TPR) repeat protein
METPFVIGLLCGGGLRRLAFPFFLTVLYFSASGEKVLMYDEEKGIIFVDKDQEKTGPVPKKESAQKKAQAPAVDREKHRPASNGRTVDASIQRGRQKDPPEVYFHSGLQYFKNNNFEDALKNFTHADSLDPQPKYVLWMGKTLRQLHKYDRLLFIMNRIVTTYPESEVADDALFEIAFCYQTNDNYDLAIKTYTKLAEQYPFGTSFSNGESFRELAHKQCQIMRTEMISSLKVLGYPGDDLESLYREFQKSKAMAVSGVGDVETIRAIKAAYENALNMAAAKERRRKRAGKFHAAAMTICAVLALNCVILFVINRKIAAKRRQLASLSQVLSELSMDAS